MTDHTPMDYPLPDERAGQEIEIQSALTLLRERDLAALAQQRDWLTARLTALVAKEPVYTEFSDDGEALDTWECCLYCQGSYDYAAERFAHQPDCPWWQAKHVLG